MFEATRLSVKWRDASLKNDLTIVPTDSSRRCWAGSGVPAKKIATCPLGVDFDLFRPNAIPLTARTLDGRSVNQFRRRFLNISESIHRKNQTGLLRAWMAATHAHDDAVLILKTGFYARGSRETFYNQLQALEQSLGKKLTNAAPVVVLDPSLSPEEMPRLYAVATHYWSMSRGEGFDLPMLEAAACGLQLIAPNHSAYQEYLTSEIAHLLPAREIPAVIPGDTALNEFFAGANWWEPDEAAAIQLLHDLICGSVTPLSPARAALARKYTWDNAADQLLVILSRIAEAT